MKRRPALAAVALAATVGVVALAAPPARATTMRRVAGFGATLTLSDGLSNPGPGAVPCLTGANPLSCGNTVNFALGSSWCASVDNPGKTGPGPLPPGNSCSLSASGMLTGFNGAATGSGWIAFADSVGGTFSGPMSVRLSGDELSFIGQANEEAFRAVIALLPDQEPEPTQEDPPPPPPRDGHGLANQSG